MLDPSIVRSWVDASSRIVALTGAGISTESGIPDFRGPQGVWTRDPKAEKLSTIHDYMADPEVRRLRVARAARSSAVDAQPNPGHRRWSTLERRGKLHALVTQNIDELHQIAGNSPDLVIEVHGTMRASMCMECGWRGPMGEVLERVRAGEDDPACQSCGGILKSATISFGQALVPRSSSARCVAADEADLLLAIGSSCRSTRLPARCRRAAPALAS